MIEDAFAQYLLQDTGFRRVTDLWIRQYQKLQHFGGTICIKDPEDDEREAIGGLLGKDYWGVRDISIPYMSGKRQSRTAGLPEVIFFVYLKFIRGKAY